MYIGLVFDEIQQAYTEKMKRWVPHYLGLVEDMISPISHASPMRILDLGSGNGNVAALILKHFDQAQIHLVDASQKMLDECKIRFQAYEEIQYELGMMQEMHLETNSKDLITACFSLHHLRVAEKEKVIHQIADWLAPGGFFSYADLFVDKKAAEHGSFLNHWQAFVMNHSTEEDWAYLFDHYQKYDHPNSLTDTVGWLQDAGFHKITLTVRDRYWVHILAQL